jgi:ribosomal protein L24E
MKCSYCTKEIEKGSGFMYVKKTGAVKYYCSDRCYNFDTVQRRKQKHKEHAELARRTAKK